MPVNFESNNLIVIAYPSFAGGKLLANCLGIADNACLQHAGLANLQLHDKLSAKDKHNLLIARLEATHYFWDDLGLGCYHLFGNRPEFEFSLMRNRPAFPVDPFKETLLDKLLTANLKLFKVAHNEKMLEPILKTWTNSSIIVFKNTEQIVSDRRPDFPANFATECERALMHKASEHRGNAVISWDCNNLQSFDSFVNSVQDLYLQLHLHEFNRQYVQDIYTAYMLAWQRAKTYLKYEQGFYVPSKI